MLWDAGPLGDPALCVPKGPLSPCAAGWAEAWGGWAKLLSVVFPATEEPEQLELNRILLIGISSNADGAN